MGERTEVTEVVVRTVINPKEEADKVRANGPGLHRGVVGRPCYFSVDYSRAEGGKLGVSLVSPRQIVQRKAQLLRAPPESGYHYMFEPVCGGEHVIKITYAGEHVPGSPFRVPVAKTSPMVQKNPMWIKAAANASKVVCSGDGLTGGIVGRPAVFIVDTRNAGDGELSIDVEYDKFESHQAKLSARFELNPSDGSYFASYTTPEPGLYRINVLYGGQPVHGSPFLAKIEPRK
jgi:filamin